MAKKTLLREVMDLQTEAEAYGLLERLRWQGRPVCPHCGSERVFYLTPKATEGRKTRTGKVSERRVWKCGACRRQFSALTGTIFHGTKVELRVWLAVVAEMCANKNGMAAREIERKYGVAPKTAWFMAHRVREAMKRRAPDSLVGIIVADETYIGGDPKNRHADDQAWLDFGAGRVGGARGRGTDKTPVLSLINAETGEVRSAVVPDVTGVTLRKVMAEQVNMAGSTLWTDEGTWYKTLGQEFAQHQTVNHSEDEYVGRLGQTTNRAEGYFSQLKRSLDGTHHRVSVEHLPRYLTEFDFRYSTCHLTDAQRVDRLMGQVEGRRLSYKRTKAR
jgi:transposase-like protein